MKKTQTRRLRENNLYWLLQQIIIFDEYMHKEDVIFDTIIENVSTTQINQINIALENKRKERI